MFEQNYFVQNVYALLNLPCEMVFVSIHILSTITALKSKSFGVFISFELFCVKNIYLANVKKITKFRSYKCRGSYMKDNIFVLSPSSPGRHVGTIYDMGLDYITFLSHLMHHLSIVGQTEIG
jgi:hypothetical protein